ncbi:MAG: UbiD family decarboxylase, partial [Bacteroidales bacterium]|nr:UbiD family decarboxylase [Bacteroidales bacterium]
NAGMYRMQILNSNTAAMHWQRHKTGANHFEAWKKKKCKMPVTVTLGGDPVYAYSATAPLPENINEYILAGFLRKKRVKLVKSITNDLYVPDDADIVIEGYVDPEEELFREGPFGDHTGFYSLEDYYPRFRITCITHSVNAIYPATIVGIPPKEDAFLAKATEKIFLAPVRIALQPEIEDFHMPDAGTAHNLLIVKIRKNYPGQGIKVISSLMGAGQMMFAKYIIVVSGNVNIRNYMELALHIMENTRFSSDIFFTKGPLDVLDHASDNFSFGGKAGIDSTIKLPEERPGKGNEDPVQGNKAMATISSMLDVKYISSFNPDLYHSGLSILILGVDTAEDPECIVKAAELLRKIHQSLPLSLVIAVDMAVDVKDLFMVAWQLLANSDPLRDHVWITDSVLLIDGTIKKLRKRGFTRDWPNVVCSDTDTIKAIDEKWNDLGFERFIPSPSLRFLPLVRNGTAAIEE